MVASILRIWIGRKDARGARVVGWVAEIWHAGESTCQAPEDLHVLVVHGFQYPAIQVHRYRGLCRKRGTENVSIPSPKHGKSGKVRKRIVSNPKQQICKLTVFGPSDGFYVDG